SATGHLCHLSEGYPSHVSQCRNNARPPAIDHYSWTFWQLFYRDRSRTKSGLGHDESTLCPIRRGTDRWVISRNRVVGAGLLLGENRIQVSAFAYQPKFLPLIDLHENSPFRPLPTRQETRPRRHG